MCPNGKFEIFRKYVREILKVLKFILIVEIENRINIEGAHRN